ncbi:MAG: flagellar biosynthesis anti-sigma factor FlgM [Acidobacteriaceae bacterium]
MRIDSTQGAHPLPESGRSAQPSQTGNTAGAVTSSNALGEDALGEDQAQLSGAHLPVQALAAQALQFPEVRQERVNALRQVVVDGTYQPGSKPVADAILAHMLVNPAAVTAA